MQIVNNLWENICLRDGQRQQTNANDEEKINADFHDSDKENKPPREDQEFEIKLEEKHWNCLVLMVFESDDRAL